jgi:CRISPR/Cas system-associated exonuclease Cas4 (RecB family)
MADILGVVIVATVIIVALVNKLKRERKKAGGIQGWVVDNELSGNGGHIYRNYKHRISGRPDVLERGRVIEYKSAAVSGDARKGDLMQVAALMVATGVDKAALQYENKTFNLSKENPIMRPHVKEVKKLSPVMLQHLKKRNAPRGNPYPKKCRKCEFRARCSDARYN